jgi:hypothetical protein
MTSRAARLRVRRIAMLLAVLVLPALAHAVCAPTARGIFPASGIVGTVVDAVVEGESLGGATVTVFGDPGLDAAVQSTSALTVNVRLTIAADAIPGERILAFTTAGGTVAVSFTVNPAGGPIVATVSPPLLATLGLPLDVTVTGASLGGVTPATIVVSGAGVTVTAATPSLDGTSLALTFGIDLAADLGTHAVTISNGVGSALLTLYVQRPAPLVTQVSPGAGEVGAVVPITLTGSGLGGAALIITGKGSNGDVDVTVSDVATPDDATLTATLTIPPGAEASTTEARLLIVTTESGQTTIEFFVVLADVPSVTVVKPGAGEPGQTVPVTLRGLNLTNGVVSVAPGDLTLPNPTVVVDDQTITVDVQIAGGATVNFNHTLTVTTGDGMATGVFRVIAAGQPFFNAARPPFGNRGTIVTVRFDGVNLGTILPGAAGVQLSQPKITESNALALDPSTAQATLDIDPTASAGYRDVTCTTSAGSFTRSSGFRVNTPGQVPMITDVSPTLVQPGTTTAMTVTGSNFEGGTVLVTGPGVTITNVVVSPDGTTITFDLTVAADAPAEIRAVIVVTPSGIARCNIATGAPEPPLVAAKLVKTGALFTVASTAFRLYVFEFSINDLFAPGLRTAGIPAADGSLTLDRADTVAIEQAFRDAHGGFVRVRAVTPTNFIAVSTGQSIRR